MKLFYHHVGQKGAEEDFKKTIFARVPITLVENSLNNNDPWKLDLVVSLYNQFPSGSFNCWGVPSGAAKVINNLELGDIVLLVENASIDGGRIPAFGEVKVFIRQELQTLSHALWGNSHFPFIFFFNTELIDMEWIEFINYLNYAPNFDPRGKFYSVANKRVSELGGTNRFLDFLRTKKILNGFDSQIIDYLKQAVRDEKQEYQTEAFHELDNILGKSEKDNPNLTDETENQPVLSSVSPRDAAFRNGILQVYGERCAVCGSNRYSPMGSPEVEAAHIFPKSQKGRDIIENGISLCKLHHWAFDSGWFSLNDDLTILVREDIPNIEIYNFIKIFDKKRIAIPENPNYHPHPSFLRAHRKLHGFEV